MDLELPLAPSSGACVDPFKFFPCRTDHDLDHVDDIDRIYDDLDHINHLDHIDPTYVGMVCRT